jgi:hypothetical protein
MTDSTTNHRRHFGAFLRCSVLAMLVSLVGAATAQANLEFEQVGVQMTGMPQPTGFTFNPETNQIDLPVYGDEFGPFTRQAGSHPDFTFSFSLPTDPNVVVNGIPSPGPPEAVHAVDVDLPRGMIGNPNVITECDTRDFAQPGVGAAHCPLSSQVGVARVSLASGGSVTAAPLLVGVFNLVHGPDVPARFGFNYSGTIAIIDGRVRPGDYGISAGSVSISQALTVKGVSLTLWGVPADPSHDLYRGGLPTPTLGVTTSLTGSERRPFLSAPTSCSDSPVSFTARGDSWEHRGVFDTRTVTADTDGTPLVFEGCERLPFVPSVNVKTLSRVADAPTGLSVDFEVPQSIEPDGLATAHVRNVVMTLPQGVTVSPSSAAGLGACSPAQIGLGTIDAPSCPDSSKLGKVTIDTPVLEDPLEGDIILATQNDNPFGSLIAMYIAVKGPGFYVKLPGRVDLDPDTGRVTAVFDNTPQLPFSRMRVEFPGGSQASLATPTTCGTFDTLVDVSSWASDTPISLSSPTRIDQGCAAEPFAPSFAAGTTNPFAGEFSPLTFALTRADRMAFFSSIDTTLPTGLIGRIAAAKQCSDALATTGACPESSRIGSTSVLAGPGAAPLGLKGRVYLTGPYKGAPFGLSIVTPTAGQAGPFDLGDVVVRAALHVDRSDAHVTVKSDPLPTIIEGIPLRLRQVNVSIDKPDFTLNPTSCQAKTIGGDFLALNGQRSHQTERFAVGGCKALPFKPRLGLTLTGRNQRVTGKHPGLKAVLRQTGIGESGIKKAAVGLPRVLALDPDNAQALCEFEDGTKDDLEKHCPKGSIIGRVKATTPLLDKPLTGNVYFVKNVRIDKKTGNKIRTLPMLIAALRGEIAINLKGTSSVTKNGRLVNTFATVPDAPITQFNLNLAGGKRGILVVTDSARGHLNICRGPQTAQISMDGQNGKFADYRARVKTPCPTKKKRKR